MTSIALAVTLFVAVAHVGFMILESVLWTGPIGRKIFALSAADAQTTKVLAMNQGLYNGGVAALLTWAAVTNHAATVDALLLFIIAMGVVGAATAKITILYTQALPAVAALVLWHL